MTRPLCNQTQPVSHMVTYVTNPPLHKFSRDPPPIPLSMLSVSVVSDHFVGSILPHLPQHLPPHLPNVLHKVVEDHPHVVTSVYLLYFHISVNVAVHEKLHICRFHLECSREERRPRRRTQMQQNKNEQEDCMQISHQKSDCD